ncbi:HPr family phosphocarrier protein [Paenibacillus aurantius]|uniref:HPr family phosphocarrier protein n=1 Tax=Paenibacillus aurantius TaxID=2918900 RepID=A0AA96LC36_9BACL|nr:HPr family phosphocarrier protein [Paenibacillus aurantius]WJH35630.1 HPr family phosphocarrier protein [Paenibacillus sp. CC-CFT747]WNQ10911.1 HPr family phosphocarrier protein [Paenibacillus aurantius]
MRIHQIQVRHTLSVADKEDLARQAGRFKSDIHFLLNDETVQVDAKSLLGLLLQSLSQGTRLTVRTRGSDELEALEYVCDLLESPQPSSGSA